MANQSLSTAVDRQNILNNPYAVEALQDQVGIKGVLIGGEYKFTIRQVADFYEVDTRTIERYIANYSDELKSNGYEVLTGERLQEAKSYFDPDTNVGIKKLRRLGVLNFRSFLNIGMVLAESDRARMLRSLILDIVLDVVSKKAGGSTKYINQRDEDYLRNLYAGEGYRKTFTDALRECVDMGNFKYAVFTNKIYKSIFREHAGEYRTILSLQKKENVRDTMYSEILTTLAMYENGLGVKIRKLSEKLGRKLKPTEVDELFREFENDPAWAPQLESVRIKMASRDYGFRDTIHPELAEYINPLNTAEFNRFLGEKSKELSARIDEYQDVFQRLKDK